MREVYEDDIRMALRADRGNISRVAFRFGLPRGEFFAYLRARPKLFNMVVDFRETLVDNAEMHLHAAVDKKLAWAIKFVMQTLGKHRRDPQNAKKTKKLETLQGNLSKMSIEELAGLDEMMNRPADVPPGPEPECFQDLDRAGEHVLETLVKFVGRLGAAAKELGVKKRHLAQYLKCRPQLQAALELKYEYLSDHAEYLLHDLIDAEEPWAIKFVLKTLGRARGYGDVSLNDLLSFSGGLVITRLTPTDLRLLERIRGMCEPAPETIGEVTVVTAKPEPALTPSTAPQSNNQGPPSNTAGEAAATPAPVVDAGMASRHLDLSPNGAASNRQGHGPSEPVGPPACDPMPAPNAATAEPEISTNVPETSVPAQPEEMEEPNCEPEPMSVKDLPVRIDVSHMTPEQQRELEIVLGRVYSKTKIREIYNPDWPDDHPIYREFDDPKPDDASRSNGERAPPDST